MFFLIYKCVSDTNYFSESVVIPPMKVSEGVDPDAHKGNGDVESAVVVSNPKQLQ